MIETHSEKYPGHAPGVRLSQVGLTPSAYHRMCHSAQERADRESLIPEEDAGAVVDFLVQHPEVGATRAHLTLIDQEKAMVSSTFINEAKHELAQLVEEEYRTRSENEKMIETELKARRQTEKEYRHIEAQYPNHIWAIDFVKVRFLSFQLTLCVIYDIFTQAYHVIEAGEGCTFTLARQSLKTAILNAGERAPKILRRDNGKAFVVETFQKLLEGHEVADGPIPPGQPWLNGSLESNNGSLKATVKTKAMQVLPHSPDRFMQAREQISKAVQLLQQACNSTRETLNCELARPKFSMPPQRVLDEQTEAVKQRQKRFKERKARERLERMERLRDDPGRSRRSKRFLDKIRRQFQAIKNSMSTNELYILNEVLHNRFQPVEI